jgi:hypothetical protein
MRKNMKIPRKKEYPEQLVIIPRIIRLPAAYVEKSQGFEVYQKETHVCKWKKTLYGFKQLDAEYLIYSRSVAKTSYDRESVSEWLLRSSG